HTHVRRARRFRRVGRAGMMTTAPALHDALPICDGGPATQAALSPPTGVAVAPDGSLYIADQSNHRVRRVGPDGIITTVAGNGTGGFSGDGGPATQAALVFPPFVAVAPDGSRYIAGTAKARDRRVGPDRTITAGA